MALPMPRPAPVTTTTAPSNVVIAYLSFQILGQQAVLESLLHHGDEKRTSLQGICRVLEGDEPCPPLEGREVHQPLERHHQAVAKADQEHEMQQQPQEPAQQTGGAKLADRDDAIEASHHGHISLVDVAKCLGVWFANGLIRNDGSHVVSLLHRYRCNTWQRFAILGTTRRISKHKNVGMTGDSQIAADLDAACPVRLSAQPCSRSGGRYPRRPNDRFSGKTLSGDYDAFTIDRFDRRIRFDFDLQTIEGLMRFFR